MSEEPQAARFTKAFTSAQEAAVAAVEDEAPEARRRPLPVRVQLERGGPLYDGLLGGWRLEGRRVFAIVEVPGRAEPLAVDPWDLYPSTAGERRTEHTEAFRRLVEGPPEPCPPKRRARRRAGTKGGQAPVKHDHLPGAKECFNARALAEGDGPLFVTEGPFDALALMAAGYPRTVAIFGVSGWRWDWAREIVELVLALDADQAGQEGWREMARGARLRGKRVWVLPPEAYGACKDASEAWAAGTLDVAGHLWEELVL